MSRYQSLYLTFPLEKLLSLRTPAHLASLISESRSVLIQLRVPALDNLLHSHIPNPPRRKLKEQKGYRPHEQRHNRHKAETPLKYYQTQQFPPHQNHAGSFMLISTTHMYSPKGFSSSPLLALLVSPAAVPAPSPVEVLDV